MLFLYFYYLDSLHILIFSGPWHIRHWCYFQTGILDLLWLRSHLFGITIINNRCLQCSFLNLLFQKMCFFSPSFWPHKLDTSVISWWLHIAVYNHCFLIGETSNSKRLSLFVSVLFSILPKSAGRIAFGNLAPVVVQIVEIYLHSSFFNETDFENTCVNQEF